MCMLPLFCSQDPELDSWPSRSRAEIISRQVSGHNTLTLYKVKVKVAQWCPTLCDPMDCMIQGILQARTLEWVTLPFSRDLPNPGIKPRSPALQADSLSADHSMGGVNISEGLGHHLLPCVRSLSTFPTFRTWGMRKTTVAGLPSMQDSPGSPPGLEPGLGVNLITSVFQSSEQPLIRSLTLENGATSLCHNLFVNHLQSVSSLNWILVTFKTLTHMGFLWQLSSKESVCQCRGHRFDPWSGKISHGAEQLSPCTTTTHSSYSRSSANK